MKVDIEKIDIVRGEFNISPSEDANNENNVLFMVAEYRLVGKGSVVIGKGVVTNSNPGAGGNIDLSKESLAAFMDFYESLQKDVEAALNTEGVVHGSSVEELLGHRR